MIDFNKKYNIVVSGGSLKCIYAVGFINQLINNGLQIKKIITTSAGAPMMSYLIGNRLDLFFDVSKKIAREYRLFNISKQGIHLGFQKNFEYTLDECINVAELNSHDIEIIFNSWVVPTTQNINWNFLKAMYISEQWLKSTPGVNNPLINKNFVREWDEIWWSTHSKEYLSTWKDMYMSTCRIPFLFKTKDGFQRNLDGGILYNIPVLKDYSEDTIVIGFNKRNIEHARYVAVSKGMDTSRWIWHAPKYVPVKLFAYGDFESFYESYLLGFNHALDYLS